MRLNLEGNDFVVIIEGDQETKRGSSRDTMGDEYSTMWRWFEGTGKIFERVTGKERVFILCTRQIESGPKGTLEGHLYSHTGPPAQKPLAEIMLKGRKPYLVDLIARQALDEIAADKTNIIPHCHLGAIDYGQLVAQGIIAGWTGQVALPGLATTT